MFLEFKYQAQTKLIEFCDEEIDDERLFIKKGTYFNFHISISISISHFLIIYSARWIRCSKQSQSEVGAANTSWFSGSSTSFEKNWTTVQELWMLDIKNSLYGFSWTIECSSSCEYCFLSLFLFSATQNLIHAQLFVLL